VHAIVQNIKILGVTFTNDLSVVLHVQQLVILNAQALYALKILCNRFCMTAIQAVFHAIVFARFLYAVFVCFTCMVRLCHSPIPTKQEGQHPLTGQHAANFRLLAN